MRTLHSTDLSDGLASLRRSFEPQRGQHSLTIVPAELERIRKAMALMQQLAESMEQELACFRLGEAGREAAGFLDDEATRQLGSLIDDPEGKVITPDFGGRKS